MLVLTKENIKSILYELKTRIQSSIGVRNCIGRASENFENWIQIEVGGLLQESLKNFNVSMEKGTNNLDIVIKQDEVIKVAIELKVLRRGGKGTKSYSNAFIKDIAKLNGVSANEKVLLQVLYINPLKRPEEPFENYFERLGKELPQHEDPGKEEFDIEYSKGKKTGGCIYLVRWDGN